MKKTDKLAAKILNDIMYPEDYGWPPTCSGVFYQPERPMTTKLQESDSIPEHEKE